MLSDLFPVSLSGVTLTNNHLASSSDISFVVLRLCGYFKASRKFALFVYLLILSVELLCLLYAIRVCLKITSTCHFFFFFFRYTFDWCAVRGRMVECGNMVSFLPCPGLFLILIMNCHRDFLSVYN